MRLVVFENIKEGITQSLVGTLTRELSGNGLWIIIWIFEGKEVTEHIHYWFFRLTFGHPSSTLLYPPQFCQLPQVKIILKLCPHIPSADQKLTDKSSGELMGKVCD